MRIEYRGKNVEEDRNYREAYICYDENKEQEKADKIFNKPEKIGWKIEQEEGCASIPVYDKEEYLNLLSDYRKIKALF